MSGAQRIHSRRFRRLSIVLGSLAAAVALLVFDAGTASASPTLQTTGSSFASVAIQQWVGQASALYGLNINWQVSFSVIGLNNFAQNQVDFAASDIPYSSQQSTYYPTQPYEYMPDVAGGLAFMFNLTGQDGQRIQSLNINAQVADGIFLGEITKWNNPAIAALNPQLAGDLPSTNIIPVYRSDASGENYLLSDYMLHEDNANFVGAQNAFISPNPGQPTAIWPVPGDGSHPSNTTYPGWGSGNLVGQNGSDNAADYVAALSSNGAITYVETAYAKEHSLPVASLFNASQNYTQPTSLDVAVALEAAVLHPDLTQDLTAVYTNPLPDTYPLSAYSYLVTPCTPSLASGQGVSCAGGPNIPSPLNPAKGLALGQFVNFLACAGQDSMPTLGYSPLPPNLVQEDFNAIGRMNGGQQPPTVSAATCKNPYVDGQIPLPGEPAIVGQTGGGLNPTTGGGSGGSGASGGPGSGSTSGSTGKTGSGSRSGSGSGSGSGKKGLTAAEVAAGDEIVDGHIVKKLGAAGSPSKYLRADQLLAAVEGTPGPNALAYIGWTLLALVVVCLPPLLMLARRRRLAAAGGLEGESADAEPAGEDRWGWLHRLGRRGGV